MTTRRLVFISAVILYSLAHDAIQLCNCIKRSNSDQCWTDRNGQKTINRSHSLCQVIGDNPAKSTEDYPCHNSERDKDYQPLLSRLLTMIDCNLCYHFLIYPVFSDTVFASTVSRQGNHCAEVYATNFGWQECKWHPEGKHMRHQTWCCHLWCLQVLLVVECWACSPALLGHLLRRDLIMA